MRATHLAVRMWSVHHRNAQSTNNFDKHNALMIFALFFTNADLGTARALAGARGVELHKTLYPFRLGRGFVGPAGGEVETLQRRLHTRARQHTITVGELIATRLAGKRRNGSGDRSFDWPSP